MSKGMDRLQQVVDEMITSIIKGHRRNGLPDKLAARSLHLIGEMFRDAERELLGPRTDLDKSTERYQALHIMTCDMLGAHIAPEHISQAADAMVACIYDLIEATK